MRNINDLVLDLMESILTKALLFDNNSSDTNTSTSITYVATSYVLSTERFDKPLFQWIY